MATEYRLANGNRLPVSVYEAENVVNAILDKECIMPGRDTYGYDSIALGSVRTIAGNTRKTHILIANSDPELATAYSYVIDFYDQVAPKQSSSGEFLVHVA